MTDPLSVDGRVPPHDLDAEAAVLSAVMLDPEALGKLAELRPEHFYSEAHRRIYEAAVELRRAGQPVDVVQIGTWLKDRERLMQVGGAPYLHTILDAAPVGSNVTAYAATVREKAHVRQVMLECQRIAAEGYGDYGAAGSFVASARERLARAATSGAVTAWAARISTATDDWYTTQPPPRKWLLCDRRENGAGVLPLGRVGLLVGAGGAGKTYALIQLAIAVATGTPWLDALEVKTPGRVLLILGEEDADEVHRRIYHARAASRASTPPPGSIITLPLAGIPCAMLERDERGNPVDAPFAWWLRDYVASIDALRLIVLDPFARFAGAEAETDNACATRAVQALEALAVASGATVIAGHHTSQAARQDAGAPSGPDAAATAARGVTGLTDGVRWVASLASQRVVGLDREDTARLGEIVVVNAAKSNYSLRWPPIRCRRDREHFGALVPLDAQDESIIADAIAGSAPPMSRPRRIPTPPSIGGRGAPL